MFSEIQKAAQNSIEKVNTEIKNLQDQVATWKFSSITNTNRYCQSLLTIKEKLSNQFQS